MATQPNNPTPNAKRLARLEDWLDAHGIDHRRWNDTIVANDEYSVNGAAYTTYITFAPDTTVADIKAWLGY